MTLSDIIAAQWDCLSDAAQDHIRRTRPHLLRQWDLIEDGHCFATIEADSLEDALRLAPDHCSTDPALYGAKSTVYADIYVRNTVTGERDMIALTIEPDEPDCEGDHEHDWRSPYSVLGGLKENPGVWGKGGGVVIKEVCAHCGRYRITDTWAQNPQTGEQGLEAVRYDDADEVSLAWVQECRDREYEG